MLFIAMALLQTKSAMYFDCIKKKTKNLLKPHNLPIPGRVTCQICIHKPRFFFLLSNQQQQ